MSNSDKHVCPVSLSGSLDNRLRRLLQNPYKILKPHIREGMTAMDMGCGPGFLTLDMAQLVGDSGKVIAVDLQTGMLDQIRDKIKGTVLENRVQLHQCTETRLGFTDPVDFVLLFYVAHELEDRGQTFKDLASILKPDGQILLIEPPGHVSRSAFKETLRLTVGAGLIKSAGPRMLMHKTAILTKADG